MSLLFSEPHCPYCHAVLNQECEMVADLMGAVRCDNCHREMLDKDIQYY